MSVRGPLLLLRVVERSVEIANGGGFRRADELELCGRCHVPWQEGELHEVDFDPVRTGGPATRLHF